jgi:dTDP-glucose 4,6-dehydratase
VLLTGAAGFIGGHLLARLLADGHEVLAVDALTYAAHLDNVPDGFRGFRIGNVADRTLMEHYVRTARPDWVINAAAETHVGRAVARADEFLESNVIGTHSMLSAALAWWREAGRPPTFRFLQVSTDEVYGSIEDDDSDYAWTEDAPFQPNNPYAASKAGADCLVRSFWITHGLPTIVTHGANTYGIRQHPEKLIPTLVTQDLAGQPLTLHGDGLNVREWISVGDHCAGIIAALRDGHPGERYNLGNGEGVTNRVVAQMVMGCLPDRQLRVQFVDDRPGNDRRYRMTGNKARLHLSWIRRQSLDEMLPAIVGWHAAHPHFAAGYGRGGPGRTTG